MDVSTAATLGGIAGVALSAVALWAIRWSDRTVEGEAAALAPESELPPGVASVISVLRSSGIVLDSSDRVVNNSPAAVAHGLVRDDKLVHAELLALARKVRRDGVIRETEFELKRGPLGEARTIVGARVAPLGADHVLLLVDDRSTARRVEQIRRDFVANVSHELKTPVGGISLLAEAVRNAHDDPEAVQRFAERITVESQRLTRLVQEIVDLSRLEGEAILREPIEVDLSAAAATAIERCQLVAADRGISVAANLKPECITWGDPELLTTAITNLVGNAVSYSETGTRVGVRTSRSMAGDGTPLIDIVVTDQGVGIDPEDQKRIFERFFRVDSARSRSTGGTGLGLSIVKHVAENHGGEVSVWSRPGQGSTFTMKVPAADRHLSGPAASADPATESLSSPSVPDAADGSDSGDGALLSHESSTGSTDEPSTRKASL